MTRLDDDLAAYLAAPTQAERQQALTQWLTDATTIINATVDRLDQAAFRFRMLKRLEIAVLQRRIVWNPQRLNQLIDEGDN